MSSKDKRSDLLPVKIEFELDERRSVHRDNTLADDVVCSFLYLTCILVAEAKKEMQRSKIHLGHSWMMEHTDYTRSLPRGWPPRRSDIY